MNSLPKDLARLHLKGAKSELSRMDDAYRTPNPQDTASLARVCLILIRCIEIQDKEIEELKKELSICRPD